VSLYKCLFDSLCSCKDRASERHRPNSRKKKGPKPLLPLRRSEDSQAVTTHHATGNRHDNRAVANSTSDPEGETSRILDQKALEDQEWAGQGGERSQERASQPKQPHTKSRDEQGNRGRDNKNNQRPTRTNTTKICRWQV